jgi:hypothetical protein
MHIIASRKDFFEALFRLGEQAQAEYAHLAERMGVKPRKQEKVVIMIIAPDEFAGQDALFTLLQDCENQFKRAIDQPRIQRVVFKTIEQASKSPYLELANFILIPDENLLDAESYPELEKLLPFQ